MEYTLTEMLLRAESVYLMAGSWSVLQTLRKVLPEAFTKNHVIARLAPLYPLVCCSAGVWIPGMLPEGVMLAERIMSGLILGYALGHSHKTISQTLLGKDKLIEAHKATKEQAESAKKPRAKKAKRS